MRFPDKSRLALFLLLLLFVGVTPLLPASEKSGEIRVVELQGQPARILMPDGSTPPLQLGEAIPVGAILKTSADSTLHLLFANGAVLILQPRSEIRIAEFDSNQPFSLSQKFPRRSAPEKSNSSTRLEVTSGLIMLDVPPLKPQSRFEITTPFGNAQTPGGRLYVRAGNKRSAVGLVEGLGVATSLIGQSQALRSGQAIGLDARGLSSPTAAEIVLLQTLDAAYGTIRQSARSHAIVPPKSRSSFTTSE